MFSLSVEQHAMVTYDNLAKLHFTIRNDNTMWCWMSKVAKQEIQTRYLLPFDML